MNETVGKRDGAGAPQRRVEPRAVRRRQLIEATIDSISRHGIAGTTMSTVTESAGLSIGIVNFHFQSKQNLLEDTLEHLAREHRAHWRAAHRAAGPDPRDKLTAVVAAHFDPEICTLRKLAVWHAYYGEARRRAVYRSMLDVYDDERQALNVRLCSQIADAGGYSAVPDVVAVSIEAMFDGLYLNLLMYPERFSRDAARAYVLAYLASVFPGHFPEEIK